MSARRDGLRNFMGKEGVFIATVQDYDYNRRRLILTDVATKGKNSEVIILAKHLHVHHIKSKLLRDIRKPNIITFRATSYNYDKDDDTGELIRNFSLENVRDIVIIRGVYNGK